MTGIAQQHHKRRQTKASQLGKELAFLFGELAEKSRELTADEVVAEAEHVADGAKRLQAHRGHPEAQRRIVRGMDERAAMALCRWIQAVR